MQAMQRQKQAPDENDDRVELRLRLRQGSQDKIQAVRVRPDAVDLSAHKGLVALPEELRRCAVRVRELRVKSSVMQALPAWFGGADGAADAGSVGVLRA